MKVFKATEGLKKNLRAFVREDAFESVVRQLEDGANRGFARTAEPESKVKTLYLATYEVNSEKGFDFSYSKNDFVLVEDTTVDLSEKYMPLCDITEEMVEAMLDKYEYSHWIGVTVLINTKQVDTVDSVVRAFRGAHKPEKATVVFGNLKREGLEVLGNTLIPFDDDNAYKYIVRVI